MGCAMFSFMVAYSSYYQIFMHEINEDYTY